MTKTIFIICQHGYGIGHLARACAIADQLTVGHGARVYLFSGGRHCAGIGIPVQANVIQMPAVEFEKITGTGHVRLQPVDTDLALEEVESARAEMLVEALHALRPDAIVIEYYPFAPERFGQTLNPLLELLSQMEVRPLTVCSVRTFPTDPTLATAAAVNALLRAHFDLVLHHTDHNVYTQQDIGEEFYEATAGVPLFVTGLVCRRASLQAQKDECEGLLFTVGGGRDGLNYLLKWLESASMSRYCNSLPITVVCGPFMPSADVERVMLWQGKNNICVLNSVTSDQMSVLMSNAAGIVCMGGYNTLNEALESQKPVLAFPRLDYVEQEKHISLLAKKGLLIAGSLMASSSEIARQLELLREFQPNYSIGFSGAAASATCIMEVCNGRIPAISPGFQGGSVVKTGSESRG